MKREMEDESIQPGHSVHPGLTIKRKIHFKNNNHGQKTIRYGEKAQNQDQHAYQDQHGYQDQPNNPGKIPRISRLMALAIRLEELVKTGEMKDFADIARLGHVSRARLSQIMNMTSLAPEIIEFLLFLPNTVKGKDPITEHEIRVISSELDWERQRKLWRELKNNNFNFKF